VVNAYAAEHLEVITADARKWAERVHNARLRVRRAARTRVPRRLLRGFEPRAAHRMHGRHASGLSVQSFLKGVHLVEYTRDALVEVAPHVLALAEAEDLPAHGTAVAVRLP